VDWYIEDYDGLEWVAEHHRTLRYHENRSLFRSTSGVW
jgi:hypothetical protein